MKRISLAVMATLLALICHAAPNGGDTEPTANRYDRGGIIQTDPSQKQISLVFTGGSYSDGADKIMAVLDKYGIEGAFFFTGEFVETYPQVVTALHDKGHYVGSHSYGHLLYMPWEDPDSLLVTYDDFVEDMARSFQVMGECGIDPQEADIFLPPYEYYNEQVAAWAKSLGLTLVNFTPGTGTNSDYTTPDMAYYRSSRQIYDRLMAYEREHSLNGNILLLHIGTHPARTDKFYDKYLERTIKTLCRKGYKFLPLKEALGLSK